MQITALFIIAGCLTISHAQKCIPRKFNAESFVCVCNSTYCDSVDISLAENGKFRSWVSCKASRRLDTEDGVFEDNTNNAIKLQLNLTKTYQKILGFGGAFTDSAGLNIKLLSEETQEQLMKTYFSPSGSRYTLARVPVGGTDFSTRQYTLDEVENDKTLSHFALAPEDINYKIPYMKRALELSPDLKFVAAAWTAPKWMKTNNGYYGFGVLKAEDYKTYANYLIKFLEAYKDNDLPIWAISTGNEPEDAFIPGMILNDMGWIPSSVAKWLVEDLGPALRASKSNQTLILALDDQRFLLPWYIDLMYLSNHKVDKYIDGIAFHWYLDAIVPASLLDSTHQKHPNKFLIMTEACTGFLPLQKAVELGSWERGEEYMHDIIEKRDLRFLKKHNEETQITFLEKVESGIKTTQPTFLSMRFPQSWNTFLYYENQDMNHWVTGWIDWNLALNTSGGPNVIHNEVDSPIIVNPENDEFYKQPMYYALAHFSKFVPRESVRIDLTSDNNIESVAFLTPQNTVVIVLLNRNDEDYSLTIVDPEDGNINVEVEKRSFRTIVYQK